MTTLALDSGKRMTFLVQKNVQPTNLDRFGRTFLLEKADKFSQRVIQPNLLFKFSFFS